MSFTDQKVLVLGCGSIGQRHLRNLHALGVQQLAYSDPSPDPEVVPQLEKELHLQGFSDTETALSTFKPDCVFICLPTGLHSTQALLAAKAGAHLFIEKPLSHSFDGIDELVNEVKEKNLVTMSACDMRFHPGPVKVKELLDSGAIGDVLAARIYAGSYLPRWRRKIPYKESYSADPKQGGVLLDLVHEIDLTLWYLGPAVLKNAVVLPATSIGLEVDGLAELSLQHESGATSNVHLSFIQQTWRRGCEIVGSKGTIEWYLRGVPGTEGAVSGKVELYGDDGELKESFSADEDPNQAYLAEEQHFLECVQNGKQTCAPISDGVAALEIALQARKSLKE